MEDKNPCVDFAKLMHQLAAWKRAEYFYLITLEAETIWQRRSVLLYEHGLIKGELEQYDEVLAYFKQSLEVKETQGAQGITEFASTYNNMATLYYKQKKMDLAIEYFQKAIEAYNVKPNSNQELVATLYGNIASVLNDQGKHEETLKSNEKCLNIRINVFPEIYPSLASTYSNISNTFHSMRCHAQALEYA
ncbi:unnamed protein product [Rotaria sp. Silwood2]|nr:unnamed protein product [Rotaria sp. Silwood2]CAF3983249.1 unnamed protein product [Rotaria sp. Silwood2]